MDALRWAVGRSLGGESGARRKRFRDRVDLKGGQDLRGLPLDARPRSFRSSTNGKPSRLDGQSWLNESSLEFEKAHQRCLKGPGGGWIGRGTGFEGLDLFLQTMNLALVFTLFEEPYRVLKEVRWILSSSGKFRDSCDHVPCRMTGECIHQQRSCDVRIFVFPQVDKGLENVR